MKSMIFHKTSFFFMLSLLFFGFPAEFFVSPASAQDENPPETKKRNEVSFVKTAEGINVLKITYPCDRHQNISVEIRILDEITTEKPYLAAPLFFGNTVMEEKDVRGKTYSDVIFHALMDDTAANIVYDKELPDPTSIAMTYGNMKMRVLGKEAVMGTRQVSVFCTKENSRTEKKEDTLVFPYPCGAKTGALPTKTTPRDAESFWFDLMEPEFRNPCKIMIWVVSGDKILLKTEADWPGRIKN